MIGQYPESNILAYRCRLYVFFAGDFFYCFNGAGKNVSIVIALFILQHPYQSFKAHAGIYMFCRQWFQAAVFYAVELHKYIVPDLNHLRMVVVHQ